MFFLRHISPRQYKVSCVGFMIWCPSGRCVAHCTFEIALSQAITLTLMLVCAFSPKVQKYLLGSLVFPLGMTNINPKRVKGTYRAEGNIAFADRQKHRIIAFTRCPVSLPGDCHATLAMTNLLHLGNNVKGTAKCVKGTHNILWFFSKTDHNLLFLFIKICYTNLVV